jgi:ribonuclease D
MGRLAEELNVPVENLLTPEFVRRLMWEPPDSATESGLSEVVAERLRGLGARQWQVDLATDPLVDAIVNGHSART